MTTIIVTLRLELTSFCIDTDNPEEVDWFFNDVLSDVSLYSSEIGDFIGNEATCVSIKDWDGRRRRCHKGGK